MDEKYKKYLEQFWYNFSDEEIEEKGIRDVFYDCVELSNSLSDPVGKKNNLKVLMFPEGKKTLKELLELVEKKAILDTEEEIKMHICDTVCFLMHLKGLNDNYINQIRTGISRMLE